MKRVAGKKKKRNEEEEEEERQRGKKYEPGDVSQVLDGWSLFPPSARWLDFL